MSFFVKGTKRPDSRRESVEVQSKKRQTWETGFQCIGKSWSSHSAEEADLDSGGEGQGCEMVSRSTG